MLNSNITITILTIATAVAWVFVAAHICKDTLKKKQAELDSTKREGR